MRKGYEVTTVVDAEDCIGCGLCVPVCPSETLEMIDGKAVVTGEESLGCGHCEAICPTDAIRVGKLDGDMLDFESFDLDKRWLRWGKGDVGDLARVIASRRSTRAYTEKPVSRALLEDLIRFGVLAPSGTNTQRWAFTVVNGRADVEAFGEHIAGVFRAVNRVASSGAAQVISKFVPGDPIKEYAAGYKEKIEEAMEEWRTGEADRLFHGAPALILVSSLPGATTGPEDALLATQNILLGAHALGLGTCLIGFAQIAMKLNPLVKPKIGIPWREKVHAVIALGHPSASEKYVHVAGRKKPLVRWTSE